MTVEEYVETGNASFVEGRFVEAHDAYERALQLQPRWAGLRFLRGRALYYLGHVHEARHDFDDAIILDPMGAQIEGGVSRYFAWRGRANFHCGFFPEARRDLRTGFGHDQDWEDLAYWLGHAELMVGDDELALARFEDASKLEPGSPNPDCDMAYVLATSRFEHLRDGERAVELAGRACEAIGMNAYASLSVLAAAHAECGEFDSAIGVVERVLELCPPYMRPHYRGRLEEFRRGEPIRTTADSRQRLHELDRSARPSPPDVRGEQEDV